MIVEYNGNQFANNEVELTISKRPIYSPRGFRIGTRETYAMVGFLHGSTQAAVTSAINDRRNWLATNGGDFKFLLDDGTTETAHVLLNADTIGGVVVTGHNFPEGTGAEYSTFRTWAATIEGTRQETENQLLAFQETITSTGGGDRFVFLQTLTGLPQKQTVAQQTPYQTVQAGSALGFQGYPLPPGPIWPAAEHIDRRSIILRGPVAQRFDYVNYGVDWSYTFEDSAPLVGTPNFS